MPCDDSSQRKETNLVDWADEVLPKDVIGASQHYEHYLKSVCGPSFCHVFVMFWEREK